MNTLVLTSFRDAPRWEGAKYSIARWRPKGCDYPKLPYLAPEYRDGVGLKAIRPTAPDLFRKLYESKVLALAKPEFEHLVGMHSDWDTVVLCCWCNMERQRTADKGYHKLFCHRVLVGYWVEDNWPQLKVIYADGAETPVWWRERAEPYQL